MLLQILFATFLGSIVSLIGGILLLIRESLAKRLSSFLVSFAAGSLVAAAFFELIPESLADGMPYETGAWYIIGGILVFFLFEKGLKWYHCHDQAVCEYHSFSSTVIAADIIHNFVDGIAIALSFAVSTEVGVATTVAVFLHEIPQEIGDFGVLLHAGWSRARVLAVNALTALTAVLGALIGYFLLPWIAPAIGLILAFIAGSFIYIAVSDLLPELRHNSSGIDVLHIVGIILGIVLVWGMGMLLPE